MKAQITKTSKTPSKFGGSFYYMFFKDEEGKTYKTALYPGYRNFKNWIPVIGKEGTWLDGLRVKADRLVDADSNFQIVEG